VQPDALHGAVPEAEMNEVATVWWLAAIATGTGCGSEPRMEPAPPGEVVIRQDPASTTECPFGGAIVASGLDDNQNGRLDDPEIRTRTMVCNDAPVEPLPPILVRLLSEPSGANCARGGTAVQSGPDRNGNGRLDDDEVMHIDYVCGEPLLTRLAAEPSGARCAAGGVVFLAGRDRDGDGALDDDEVEVTEISCGDRLERDVELRSFSDMMALNDVRVITGTLMIHHTGMIDVSLPRLAQLGGALQIVEDAGTTISLPALQSVTGRLTIRGNEVSEVDFPQLRHIGSLELGHSALADLAGFPVLAEIAGDVQIGNVPTLISAELSPTRIDGNLSIGFNPMLASIQWTVRDRLGNVNVAGNNRLETLRLSVVPAPNARSVLGDVRIASPSSLATVELSANRVRSVDIGSSGLRDLALDLGTVESDLEIFGDTSPFGLALSDPDDKGHVQVVGKLQISGPLDALHSSDGLTVEGSALFDRTQLRELAPVGPIRVLGALHLSRNPLLTLVAPIEVGGSLIVVDNALLPTLAFPRFALPGEVLGDLIVTGNPVLASAPALGALTRVRGEASFAFNPLLPSLFGPPLVRIDGALSLTENASITELSLPNLAEVGTSISLFSNASLTRVSLPVVADVSHDLFISSNQQLRHIAFDALTHAALFIVNDNPRLPTCEVLALFERVEGEHGQSGNDDDAPCVGHPGGPGMRTRE
jgi:hypothetical protein